MGLFVVHHNFSTVLLAGQEKSRSSAYHTDLTSAQSTARPRSEPGQVKVRQFPDTGRKKGENCRTDRTFDRDIGRIRPVFIQNLSSSSSSGSGRRKIRTLCLINVFCCSTSQPKRENGDVSSLLYGLLKARPARSENVQIYVGIGT